VNTSGHIYATENKAQLVQLTYADTYMIFMKSILLQVLTLLTLVRNVLGRNVTWDKYSLSLDGERSFIFSGYTLLAYFPCIWHFTDVYGFALESGIITGCRLQTYGQMYFKSSKPLA
jgi:hypothetical protein